MLLEPLRPVDVDRDMAIEAMPRGQLAPAPEPTELKVLGDLE